MLFVFRLSRLSLLCMKPVHYYLFLLAVFSFALSSCQDPTEKTVPVNIQRLETEIFGAKTPNDLAALFNKHPYLKAYFGLPKNASDSLLVAQLFANINNQDLQQFQKELQAQFGDLADLQDQLQGAFGQIKANYPTFKAPQVMTAITGFMGTDLYVSDSVIVIGLDYFGGPKAKYRPQLHDYQLRRYQQEYIVPAILFFISEKYNKVAKEDQTLLADMIWYGKGFEFVKHIAPATADSLIIGYSTQQLADVYASQEDIWAYFIDRKLLYQTRDAEKDRFIGERPATPEISQYCPGGIARWVGWRIVSRYLQEKPSTSLTDLMNTTDPRKILEDSKYKGQKEEE